MQEVEEEVPVEMEVDAPKDGAAAAESDKKEHISFKVHYWINFYSTENKFHKID